MKAHKNWSYRPYKPLFYDSGDIYICAIAPLPTQLRFDWLPLFEGAQYEVFLRKRNVGEFQKVAETTECSCTIENLESECDYEFYVSCGDQKSRVRLARCGESFGTVVNYLHPDDLKYAFSGNKLVTFMFSAGASPCPTMHQPNSISPTNSNLFIKTCILSL